MTERENLLHVINRTGKAQWIPISEDCLISILPSPIRDRPVLGEDGFDWFGCYWIFDPRLNGYVQPPSHPLPLTELSRWRDQVRFPDLEAIDWAEGAQRDLKGIDRGSNLLFIKTESGAFERLHQMYGFENAFVAMYEEPDSFLSLMEAISEFRIRLYNKIMDHYQPEIVLMMDDLGSSRGPLISLEMYRKLIKPFDARIAQAIHARGAYVAYHSCGCMQDFIGDLIEMGADMIHPFQGGINKQEKAESEYGDKVVFCNALDNLVHLPETSEQMLRAEMRRIMRLFWEKKNLIVMPNSYAPNHSKILLDEAREFNLSLMRG